MLSLGGEGFFSPPEITVSGVATTSCDVCSKVGTLAFSGVVRIGQSRFPQFEHVDHSTSRRPRVPEGPGDPELGSVRERGSRSSPVLL